MKTLTSEITAEQSNCFAMLFSQVAQAELDRALVTISKQELNGDYHPADYTDELSSPLATIALEETLANILSESDADMQMVELQWFAIRMMRAAQVIAVRRIFTAERVEVEDLMYPTN